MADPDFKYDVAFSFLSQDESIAVDLNDQVSRSVSTFLYTERQKELAGTDGQVSFNRVFGQEARTVVVLFRLGWGGRGWTGVEQTAIQNRGLNEGWNFLTVVSVTDESPKAPVWLPSTRLWAGYKRFGLQATADIIESRVQEAGGAPRIETAVETALRVKAELEADEARQAFLHSPQGVEAARAEFVDRLWPTLQKNAHGSQGLLTAKRTDLVCEIGTNGLPTLTFALDQMYHNTTDKLELRVLDHRGIEGFFATLFTFDRRTPDEYGWRNSDQVFVTTAALAEAAVKSFVQRLSPAGDADPV